MPRSINEGVFSQAAPQYHHSELLKRDLMNLVQQYNGLTLKLSGFVFNDGSEKQLLNLDGTIPVPFKGTTYNIPVCIWLLNNHPYNPPMCYVKPTATMLIKVSKHVDQNGKIYLPYLHEWKYGSSDLLGLIQVMIIIFGEQPPVFSKSAAKTPSYNSYPNSYMPMPTVSGNTNAGVQPSGYPPYPMTSSSNTGYPPSSVYPPYPNSTQSSYNSSFQQYPPSYRGTTPYPPQAQSYQMAANPSYPPYPPTSNGPLNKDMNTGNEERLLQFSAVEAKLRQQLDEVFSQMQAEIEVLKKTRTDLTNGKSHLSNVIGKLQSEHDQLDHNIRVLKDKDTEMQEVLAKIDTQDEIDVDEAVTTTAPLYKQLLQLYAEENATQDAIYYLGEGLRRGVIDLDVFLKHTRELSRKQFMLRALMQKCREKARLPY